MTELCKGKITKEKTQAVLKNLDYLLLESGIPKEQFYAESGVSSASVSQWNTGRHAPTAKTVKRIADYFGVTVSALLADSETPAPADGDGLAEWKAAWESATPAAREAALAVLRLGVQPPATPAKPEP